MNWLGSIFSTRKAVDDLLDKDNGLIAKAGAWIGNLSLTQEEVVEFNAKTVMGVQEFVKETLDESTERSRTRRSVAILWIKSQLAIVMFACISAPWNIELAKFYLALATSGLMITGTTAVIIFFFGSHGIARIEKERKK